jgi:hypothetical protein
MQMLESDHQGHDTAILHGFQAGLAAARATLPIDDCPESLRLAVKSGIVE